MADIELVIDIPEEEYNLIKTQVEFGITNPLKMRIANGTQLPKGHGELIDKNLIINEMEQTYKNSLLEPFAKLFVDFMAYIDDAPTIIEADKEYEAEVITRGKCMMCGKELTKGLFFCKECEDKASSRK